MTTKRDLSRADSVRQRRERENKKRVQQATRRAYDPTPTVRSRSKTVAAVTPRRASNQRRFNIALGVLPGIHTQGLHLPKMRPGSRTASLIVSVTLLVVIYIGWTLPYFRAAWATVIGNSHVTADEINAAMGVAGQSIFTLQPDELETRLRVSYPELTSVDVEVYLPNYVYVTVTEREPVIIWQQGEGYTWIDGEGVAFRPRGFVEGLIPVIGNGAPPMGTVGMDDPLAPTPYISREMVDAILVLAPNVPAGSVMVYDPQNGLGWTDSRGWQAFFGTDPTDMALKFRVYQSLVDSLMARGLYPTIISVEYPDAPFYRMPKSSDGDGD